MTYTPIIRTVTRQARSTGVEAIASQMAHLMREITPPERLGDELPPTRASVMNLLVHTWNTETAERAAESIGHLSVLHPSRSLIIIAQPEAGETALDASVSAHCHVHPQAHELICFEEVLLWAKGATASHLASIAVPLLVPDLPTFLWWAEPPLREEESLLNVCHRLIVDSSAFGEPLNQLAALSTLVSGPEAPAISDFTWARLTPWRELIAQFFDGLELLPFLHRLSNVHIEYATDPGGTTHAAEPLLLTGWLAGRLNWQPEEVAVRAHARDYRMTFTRDSGQVTVQIVPRARPGELGASGELLLVELTVADAEQDARFTVARMDDGEHARTSAHLPGLREVVRTVPLEHLSPADLLRTELSILKHDHAFEEGLEVLARLLR